MAETALRPDTPAFLMRLPQATQLDEHQLFQLCQLNPELHIERTAQGDLEIMPPTAGASGNQNARLTALLTVWSLQDGTGEAFDSSTGFILPSGAVRSPDASWVRKARIERLSRSQWEEGFLPLCPDFVADIRSRSDSLPVLQAKLREYVLNGAHLGWLLDPIQRRVWAFRQDTEVEMLDDPREISGESVLPSFVLDLYLLWGAG